MPVDIEFSMARRNVVSATSACWVCMRRRVCRQLAISIQAVIALRAQTSQNRPLPITPSDVRHAWTRRISPLPTGETGASSSLTWVAQGSSPNVFCRTGIERPARTAFFPSSSATAYLAEISVGTP